MSMKIKVSYTNEVEERSIMSILKPLLGFYKVKKCEGKPPYKHIYFTPKNGANPHE